MILADLLVLVAILTLAWLARERYREHEAVLAWAEHTARHRAASREADMMREIMRIRAEIAWLHKLRTVDQDQPGGTYRRPGS